MSGGWHRLAATDGAAGVVIPAASETNLADRAAFDFFDSFDDAGPASTLISHLDESFIFTRGFDHHFAFPGIMAAGLLDVDVLAGVASHDGGGCVPMVGSGDEKGVEIGIFQDAADIDLQFGGSFLFFGNDLLGAREAFLIDVAEVNDLGV